MSAFTTLSVSRRAALEKLMDLLGTGSSNEEIGDALDALLYHTLYNFSVVGHDDASDDPTLRGLSHRKRPYDASMAALAIEEAGFRIGSSGSGGVTLCCLECGRDGGSHWSDCSKSK